MCRYHSGGCLSPIPLRKVPVPHLVGYIDNDPFSVIRLNRALDNLKMVFAYVLGFSPWFAILGGPVVPTLRDFLFLLPVTCGISPVTRSGGIYVAPYRLIKRQTL